MPAPVPLTDATLDQLPGDVAAPGYDRAALRPAVVHIGVGGFHRAHQAVYFDDLARTGETGWGVVGVGLHSRAIGEVLEAQDRLYLVVERGPEQDSGRVVGVHTGYLHAPSDPEAVLATLAAETTRLVTITITGTAYAIDPHTGDFTPGDDEGVAHDLADPEHPETVFGYLVEGLRRRRDAGLPPFTVLSCDNMQSNGEAARTAIVSFARERDAGLADWIDANVSFPSSMVDRITPATPPEERDAVAAALGVDDRWPVIAEPFRQWVVEDRFCNERPPLDRVGVQFVDDVGPYETMKTRLLNGAHTAIAYLGYLAGHRTTDEVMSDPVYREFLTRLLAEEIAPLLPEVPGVDIAEYQQTLLDRLGNPRMADQLSRLGRRGSSKIPNYLLPSAREAIEAGRPHQLLCLAIAGWLRFLRGEDYAGDEVPLEGPRLDLVPIAQEGGSDPSSLLDEQAVFHDFGRHPEFAAEVRRALESLERQGPREAIEEQLRAGSEAQA